MSNSRMSDPVWGKLGHGAQEQDLSFQLKEEKQGQIVYKYAFHIYINPEDGDEKTVKGQTPKHLKPQT